MALALFVKRPHGWGARVAMVANQLPQTAAPLLMLEREAEMATLETILGAAREGEGRLVVVEGSAGIGKTRLLAETRKLAAETQFQVFAARGGEREGSSRSGSSVSCSRLLSLPRHRICAPSCSAARPASALHSSRRRRQPRRETAQSPRSRCCTGF